jgi:hypothetical protein
MHNVRSYIHLSNEISNNFEEIANLKMKLKYLDLNNFEEIQIFEGVKEKCEEDMQKSIEKLTKDSILLFGKMV